MKKLMILAAMSTGLLAMGDVQQAEAGGRSSFGISIGSSPYGNSFGLTYGRGLYGRGIGNRGFGYGPGLHRGVGYRGLGYGNYGGGGLYRRPSRSVFISPRYGGGFGGYGGGYGGFGGRRCGY